MYLQQLRAGKPTSVCVFVCFSGFTMQELHYCRRQLLVMHLRRFFSVRLQRATSRDVKSYISKPTRRCYCSCCWLWLWWWLYSVLHPSFYLRITFMLELDQLCNVFNSMPAFRPTRLSNACESHLIIQCYFIYLRITFWIRNWTHVATHLVVLSVIVLVGVIVFNKSPRLRRFKSDRHITGGFVRKVKRTLMEGVGPSMWCHTLKTTAETSAGHSLCSSVCRLPASPPSAYDGSSWSIIHSYLLNLFLFYLHVPHMCLKLTFRFLYRITCGTVCT